MASKKILCTHLLFFVITISVVAHPGSLFHNSVMVQADSFAKVDHEAMKAIKMEMGLQPTPREKFYPDDDKLYKSGYFITVDGDTTKALILDAAWRDNPVSFTYKIEPEGKEKEASITDVSEFSIPNVFKYIRATVPLDLSAKSNKQVLDSGKPDYQKQTVFLKVIVNGSADLYYYQDGGMKLFFYQAANYAIRPLIYKKYLTRNGKIAQNQQYLEEVWKNVNCFTKTKLEMSEIDYNQRSLKKHFVEHNRCLQSDVTVYKLKPGGALFNISLIPGFNLTQLESTVRINEGNDSFEHNKSSTFRLGVAIEYRASRISKWSIILEPAYRVMDEQYSIRNRDFDLDFQAFQIPVMIRRYFDLSNSFAIYANPILLGTLPFDSKIEVENLPNVFEGRLVKYINLRLDVGGGIGFRFKRYSVEFRRYLNKDLILVGDTSFNIGTDRMLSTITFGIRLF